MLGCFHQWERNAQGDIAATSFSVLEGGGGRIMRCIKGADRESIEGFGEVVQKS